MCYCFVSEGIHHGFHVPASVDHQQLRNLKKITLMACRLPAWRKSQMVHSQARWDQHMHKEVITNFVESFLGILIWVSTSSICCSHIWVFAVVPRLTSVLLHSGGFWHKRGGHVDFDIAQAW